MKENKHLDGEIICPGDKSISQRILIIGSLLNCDMEIEGFLDAYDPNSTLNALNNIGASITKNNNSVILTKRSNSFINASEELDLGNSGTGIRLMLGLVTLEDIIETVFGLEIVDESDTVVDLQVLARQKGNKVKK